MNIQGKYNSAVIYAEGVDETSYKQILDLLNHPIAEGAKIAFMPDVHAGAGAVIGTTMSLTDIIIPNIVGVDIGCGVMAAELEENKIDFQELDNVIREFIPSGMNVRKEIYHGIPKDLIAKIINTAKRTNQDIDYALYSLGTLGGGNHFIEVDKSDNGKLYLTVHSGSRNFGLKIAKHYQDLAKKNIVNDQKQKIIDKLKKQGQEKLIQEELSKIKTVKIPKMMAYLKGDLAQEYFKDMQVAQEYAHFNRKIMINIIVKKMDLHVRSWIESVHNYIDFKDRVIRKGAISAHKGQQVIIPLNMRDGVIIGEGKGNPDWNYSAPHGAGRVMGRRQAKEQLDLNEFKSQMEGIWTSCVSFSTLDESPMAYKDSNHIIQYVKDTVEISELLKPVYNFKAEE